MKYLKLLNSKEMEIIEENSLLVEYEYTSELIRKELIFLDCSDHEDPEGFLIIARIAFRYFFNPYLKIPGPYPVIPEEFRNKIYTDDMDD
jgi:hypothetical protein